MSRSTRASYRDQQLPPNDVRSRAGLAIQPVPYWYRGVLIEIACRSRTPLALYLHIILLIYLRAYKHLSGCQAGAVGSVVLLRYIKETNTKVLIKICIDNFNSLAQHIYKLKQ